MKQNNESLINEELENEELSDDIIEFLSDKAGERIDKYLSEKLPNYSRSYLKGLIDEDRVLVEGKAVKSSFKVFNGAAVTVNIPPLKEVEITPENIRLRKKFLTETERKRNKIA